jgi:hypothetical protein
LCFPHRTEYRPITIKAEPTILHPCQRN